MDDKVKQKKQLGNELKELYRQIAKLKASAIQSYQPQGMFRELLESVPDAVVVVNEYGEILFANTCTEEMFGYNLDELAGQSVEILMPGRFRKAHARYREDYRAQPRMRPMGSELNLVGRRKDGCEFPVDINLSPIETEDGVLILSVIRDIIKYKQTEETLQKACKELEKRVEERTTELLRTNERLQQEMNKRRQAEEGMRLLAKFPDENPHPVLRISREGVVLYANQSSQALLRVWGHEVGQALSGDWPQIAGSVLDSGSCTELEVEIKDRIFSFSIMSMVDEHSIYLYGQDITERKQIEEQFRQAQKMEAIGRLAGGVAHDFNNLLTVIIGHSALLLSQLKDTDLGQDIKQIEKAGERAASLTRQLLAFSRKQVLQPKILDLNGIVSDVEKMLRRLIGEDIDLGIALDPGLGRVKADPGQVEQVILNLVINARDAMPWGGKITIETTNVNLDETYTRRHVGVESGPYVMLAVSDNGIGMDERTLAHIYEPFFTTKGKDKGTGLGLATVYGIVKQSNGHIWVYSEPGQGATFKVYLPRVEESLGVSEASSARARPIRGSETILLVEDETQVRNLTRKILQENGYTVLEARHGEEALELCQQNEGPIHLLLTDVVMPGGMSGRELAERLLSLRPEIKVLYMSGYTDNAIIHHGVLDAGTAFIQKPFDPNALAHKVRAVLDG